METIHIYHTNDVHSHFDQWLRIQHFLLDQKKLHQEAGEEVFLFDIGDFVDLWHPFTEGTKGKGNTKLLNSCGYTAVTIGNNEGINLSHAELDHLYEDREFDVLAANLYTQDAHHPKWLKPYKIYRTNRGTRIGVIGLTAFFYQLYHLLGWQLTDPILELRKWIHTVKEQSDVIILLSHLGIDYDERIAKEFPEIPIILGGHTHHVLPNGKRVNRSLLTGAGKYGSYLGHVTLEMNDQKQLKTSKAILYDVNKLPAAADEEILANRIFQKGKEMLSQKVTTLTKTLSSDFSQETELSSLLCSALREWCSADCAFLNAGLLLGPLAGEVTNYQLLKVCPHPINPCKVELPGEELKQVLMETRDEKWLHQQVIGLGFRGTVMGTFVYNQITFKDKIFIKNQEIDDRKKYSVAIPDMYTFGRFFPEIFRCKQKRYYLPEFLRDILRWKLQMNA